MKASLPISIVALLFSIVAFVIAITSKTNVSEDEIQQKVDLALARKEKAYVQSWAPKMDRIYQDMLGPRYTKPKQDPETFAELFLPAIQIVNGMTTQ